jgi:glycosyltransferase involved in cell wall biosynthesis
MPRFAQRLGVFVDAPHRLVRASRRTQVAVDPADFAYVGVWIGEVARHFESALLFARATPAAELGHFVPLPARLRLVPLPYYRDLRQLGAVLRALPGTTRRFWREVDDVDALWIIGPHPYGLVFVLVAAVRGKRVVLGVRQETVPYFRARLPTAGWRPALVIARALDASDRLLARRLRTIVTAPEIARRYGGEGPRLLVAAESVLSARDVAATPPLRDWTGTIGLLTVGRLDPEKNPLLLVEALAQLEHEEPGRYRLVCVGGGPSEADVRRRAAELEVEARLELRGWLPYGPELLDLYRRAHVFVHVSLTEGIPKVLMEALGSGTPIVATAVGGVPGLLDGGKAGLLVPPSDVDALVNGIRGVASDASATSERVSRGLEIARGLTLEHRAERVARFIAGEHVAPDSQD